MIEGDEMAEYIDDIIFNPDPLFCLQKSEEKFTDWLYSNIVTANADDYMDKTYDYTDKVTHVYNQRDTGFCWAYSTAAMQSIYEGIETGTNIVLSPIYIAKKGKELDGTKTEGSTTKNSIEVITKFGSIKEEFYPEENYVTGSLNFPAVGYENKLRHYKSQKYARLNNLNDIVLALSQKKLPLIGIQCTREIYDTKNNKTKYLEFDKNGKIMIIGGHQMLVVGWFPNMEHNGHKGYIKCLNSWGTSCGENGFIYIPRDYIEFRTKDNYFCMMADAYSTVDLSNENIKEICVEMWVNKEEAFINDKEVFLDVSPVLVNDRCCVPLRFISEAFGAKVEWNDSAKKITIRDNKNTICLWVGKDYALINGVKTILDVKPFINNDRCIVPLRFIAEALNFVVLWHGSESKRITILR